MRAGTVVRLPDGREGTVVYHGLDGYGIVWGRVEADPDFYERETRGVPGLTATPEVAGMLPPEALLREPYEGAKLPCVGADYKELS